MVAVLPIKTRCKINNKISVGMASSASTIRIKSASTQPPKYPATRPTTVPSEIEIITAVMPIISEIWPP